MPPMATKTRPDSVVFEVTIPNYYWWSPKVGHSTGSLGSQRVLFRAGCPRKASTLRIYWCQCLELLSQERQRSGCVALSFGGETLDYDWPNLINQLLRLLLGNHCRQIPSAGSPSTKTSITITAIVRGTDEIPFYYRKLIADPTNRVLVRPFSVCDDMW